MHPRDQTIFALSSGRPPSAIAIVRVSGPEAGTTLAALAGKIPAPRTATRALLNDVGQRPIDDSVVLWFPGPASATGEDVAEFHVHGGRAVVAIAGPPNVGKSTLINQLARREVAIVSPHAGTTRDIIEVQLDLDGYPVTVIDTAGIRETSDPVEQEVVRRARARAGEADLVLWMIDAQHEQSPQQGAAPVWTGRNKIDLDAEGTDA